MGHDHGFGRGRLGDTTALKVMGSERGFAVTVLEPVVGADAAPISSTVIRQAITSGDLARAADCLGRWYGVRGRVIGGDKRGRLLGFPTLNLETPSSEKLLPPDGVYAVRVQTPHGEFGGMLNLGPRPTFGEASRRIEAHVFDVSHDWYGASVRIDFIARLRDTQAFADMTALTEQLRRDESAARTALQGA